MSPLRQQMQNDMVLRGFAVRTQSAYIACVKGIAHFYRRPPENLSQDEVQHYLLHLINERKLSWSTTNQAASALTFLFHVTLKQSAASFIIPYRKVPTRLPGVLSPAEAGRIIDAARHMTDRTRLMVTYAAGLRVSETCALKVSNIDSTRMVLHIEQGKGAKGRLSLLPPELLGQFRHYWRTMLAQLRKHDWVVYAKAPLGGPAQVLEYLARYTHRISISNERLTSLHDGMVTFAVRNKEPGGPRKRQERLPANVFIQRFMQHVLPSGLKRIRHYGVLANCHKKAKLALCRSALNAPQPEPVVIEAIATFMQRVAQIDITCCTSCKTGHFHVTAAISPNRSHATQTSPHQTGPPP